MLYKHHLKEFDSWLENSLMTDSDKIAFDGGLTEFPPKIISPYFEISLNKYNSRNIEKAFLGLITKNVSIQIIQELYSKGYHDSHYQKKDIDKYFGGNNI